jgi:hypothetical protein
MQKIASAARSHAAKPAAGERKGRGETSDAASPSSGRNIDAARRKITHQERMAALRFIKAAHEEALRYIAMTEEEVEEEYRRAGKLHVYDPDTEWQKRCARIGRMYPPPKFLAPELDEFTKLLEEDEHDYPIGLAGCIGIFL